MIFANFFQKEPLVFGQLGAPHSIGNLDADHVAFNRDGLNMTGHRAPEKADRHGLEQGFLKIWMAAMCA